MLFDQALVWTVCVKVRSRGNIYYSVLFSWSTLLLEEEESSNSKRVVQYFTMADTTLPKGKSVISEPLWRKCSGVEYRASADQWAFLYNALDLLPPSSVQPKFQKLNHFEKNLFAVLSNVDNNGNVSGQTFGQYPRNHQHTFGFSMGKYIF